MSSYSHSLTYLRFFQTRKFGNFVELLLEQVRLICFKREWPREPDVHYVDMFAKEVKLTPLSKE